MPGPSAVIVHSFIKPTSELITSSLSIAVKGLFKSTFWKKKKKALMLKFSQTQETESWNFVLCMLKNCWKFYVCP